MPTSPPFLSRRRVARNAALQLSGDVVSKLASIAFYVAMGRHFGQSGLGDFTFALSVSVLCLGLIDLGTDPIVARTIARKVEDIHHIYWNAFVVKLGLGAIAVLAANAVALVGDYGTTTRLVVLVLSLAALTETLTQTPYAAFEGYGDLKPVAVGLGLERFLAAGLGITAMALGVGLVVVGVCYLAAALSAFVYVNQAVARRIARPQLTISRATLRRLLIASAPIALSFAFAPILSRGGTAILSAYKGNDAVGLYAAGYRLFEGTFFIGWALVGALVPMLSRAGRTTQPSIDRLFELGLKVLTFSLLPVTVGMLLFARTIVTTLFGEGFADAASATQWLAAAVWLYGIARLASATLVAQDRAGLLPWVTGGSALTSVVAGLLLIPGHSFNGAAAASTGGWAVEAVLAVGAVLRFAPRVSFPRMVLASVVGCAAMIVAAVLLGRGLYGLVIAAVAYVAVAGLLERRLFPRDFELITSSLARRGPVESSADAPLLL